MRGFYEKRIQDQRSPDCRHHSDSCIGTSHHLFAWCELSLVQPHLGGHSRVVWTDFGRTGVFAPQVQLEPRSHVVRTIQTVSQQGDQGAVHFKFIRIFQRYRRHYNFLHRRSRTRRRNPRKNRTRLFADLHRAFHQENQVV